MSDDYCELCDLPKSQCVHGRPPAPPTPVTKAPPKPRTRTTTRTTTGRTPGAPAAPARPVVRRWTPPDALKPLILSVLDEAGGELEADAFFAEMESRYGDQLVPGDHERTPEGELRWHFAARRARQQLIGEGLMTKAGPGVWKQA